MNSMILYTPVHGLGSMYFTNHIPRTDSLYCLRDAAAVSPVRVISGTIPVIRWYEVWYGDEVNPSRSLELLCAVCENAFFGNRIRNSAK